MKVHKLLLIPIVCFGFLPKAFAVVPPPDGGYPNFTTAEGTNALKNLTSGAANTGIGWYSLFTNSTASNNTGVGAATLALNNGDENTATGTGALFLNTSGNGNTAAGAFALIFNDTGIANTASGDRALFSNTGGNFNTATGFFALHDNIGGTGNTANGASALLHNTTGSLNTAIGGNALLSNTEGTDNTATGANALSSNTNGEHNTAIGVAALSANTSGDDNTAVGFQALSTDSPSGRNTAVGSEALVHTRSGDNTGIGSNTLQVNQDGARNTAVGSFALGNSLGSDNTALGWSAGNSVNLANNTICIGTSGADVSDSCYIGNIWQQSGGSQAVYVNASGKLGAQVSSRRFKHDINPMKQSSEVIYRLNPVSFRYNAEIEPTHPLAFGLIAEEVAEVDPNLIARDKNGNAFSVRYDQVNAMLLNEFLKEHRKNQAQEATILRQQKQIDALTAGLQKVSAELELSKFATVRIRRGGHTAQLAATHRD